MNSRLETFTVDPDRWRDFEWEWKKLVVARRHTQGLQMRLLVRSLENEGEGFTLSVWDSLEALTAFEDRHRQPGQPSLERFYIGEYAHRWGEVRFIRGGLNQTS